MTAPMKNPFLIGARVYLRPVEREDAPVFAPWMNDPALRRLLRTRKPINLQTEIEFIDRVNASDQEMVLGIALKDGDRLIGATGFMEIDTVNRHCVFGITIGLAEFQNQGLGAEATTLLLGHAFETMNLNRVQLQVYEYNERAIKTYTRLGFQREGTLRQENFRDGRYWDTWVMAVLREEWNKDR
jgi:RimJ/RimL family protein N-acetyltransferase